MTKNVKVRVNITVDKDKLDRAKKKLGLFGGKLSTLFNVYLDEFVKSMDKDFGSGREERKEILDRLKELEKRIGKLED